MLGLGDLVSSSVYVLGGRQLHNNFEARRLEVFGADRTAVHANRFRSNREPQTIPSRCFPFPVYSIEGLKYCLERIFGNPRTVVPDRKKH